MEQRSTSKSTDPTDPIVGVVGAPHGVRGEVKVQPRTDVAERFRKGSRLSCDGIGELVIASVRGTAEVPIVRFEGHSTRTDAERIRGRMLRVARARAAGQIQLAVHDIREWATDRHHVVDDTPYGGGAGMVLKPEPLTRAIRATKADRGHVVLMTAQGALFDQIAAHRLAQLPHLVIVCGHYEGVDERVIERDVDEEL